MPASFPTSFQQGRLWFLDEFERGNPAYNLPRLFRIVGDLDVEALRQSIDAVVRRHESLRTIFSSIEGQPRQVILRDVEVSLPIIDLERRSSSEGRTETMRLVAQEAKKPFDLSRGPLIRTTLIKTGRDEHVLMLTTHHIVTDGWSMSVMFDEIAAAYVAIVNRQPLTVPELPIQYSEYVAWQAELLKEPRVTEELEYWKSKLAGAPTSLDLPTDRRRPALHTTNGASEKTAIDVSTTEQLQALAQAHGASLFMVLIAAFQALLWRYTRQESILLGTPVAGRIDVETEKLIGLFVNTLVLRADFDEDMSFLDLLKQVRESSFEAYLHQDLPFEKLVEHLVPERPLDRTPLFQAMFVFQNIPPQVLRMPGLVIEEVEFETGVSKFDLTLETDTEDGLRCRFEYNTDLFDRTTIKRMVGHYTNILRSTVADPAQKIAAIPLLTDPERKQILSEWNSTAFDYDLDRPLNLWIEDQAERTPEAPALIFGSEQLSYAEFNARANKLAHWLRSQGVRPDTLVGVCADRSIEMVVALHAIVKAGGAYVPLDPAYPRERLWAMLEDANPAFVLTQKHLVERLPAANVRTLCLDFQWQEVDAHPAENLPCITNRKNLAYVIYTSGSTGKPKGVPNLHQGIVNRLLWMQRAYGLSSTDRVLQKTPYSFDVSVWEFFWPLMTGASLVVAIPDGHKDPEYLVNAVKRQGITTMHFVPSMLQMFLQEPRVEECTSLRRVFCSGEALPYEVQQRFFEVSNAELHNLYGPTEAAVDVTYWQCRRDYPRNIVPIGRPIDNIQIYILDRNFEPVPIGVAGELHIGGIGLARGYLNRPELTAEKFIRDPFSSKGRLYKTGDLARFLPDGNIEYLGRIDHQVKIRGFRIELGEIENVLDRHPDVLQSVVMARSDQPGDKRLVAYVVPRQQPGPSSKQLQEYARQILPDFMVPSAFVNMEALPLSSNGKVNRRELPIPEYSDSGSDVLFVEPRTKEEAVLAKIWADLLHVPAVGVNQNFFLLGGHSLLAAQAMARLRRAFNVDLPLRALFERPTVAQLAGEVSAMEHTVDELHERIRRASPDEPQQISFAQRRLYFLDQLEPGSAAYNLWQAIRISGELDQEALSRSMQALVDRHASLRTIFYMDEIDGEPRPLVMPALEVRIPELDLRHLPESERESRALQLTAEEGHKPFSLDTGPLFRLQLLRINEREHILSLAMHHIITDGWSMGILFQEISTFYKSYVNGAPAALAPLPIDYTDFAKWQRERVGGELLRKQVEFWRDNLRGAETVLDIATDRPRASVAKALGAAERMTLNADIKDQITSLSLSEEATSFMVMLAAFQSLLWHYTHQNSILVGTPVAGRSEVETENVIGLFVNTLVMRGDFAPNVTFRELLAQVKTTYLEAHAHQDVPFEKLVEELEPARSLAHTPFFQVMFVYQNLPQEEIGLPGLVLREIDFESAVTAKFDFTFEVFEGESLFCKLEYNSEIFERSTVQGMITHFGNLLQAAVKEPNLPISQLPILTEQERRQILVEWNSTAAPYERDLCIHTAFERQAATRPDLLALIHGPESVSFAELNERANRLAHYLISEGVRPGDRIGICLHRSPALIAALLAVLKTGAAYVPLDPGYPTDRLAFMAQDAELWGVITQQSARQKLPPTLRTISLDTEEATKVKAFSAANPRVPVSSTDRSYIIYTSGSTGLPKGVEGTHRATLNRCSWMWQQYPFSSDEKCCVKTNLGFVDSVWEIFGPLLAGTPNVLIEEDAVRSPQDLLVLLAQHDITRIVLVPSLLRTLLDSTNDLQNRVPKLRLWSCSGEILPAELSSRFLAAMPQATLLNIYGSSEVAADVTCHEVTAADTTPSAPIGKPISNTQIYVLDEQLLPVPIGVRGEIYVGGNCLARGYWNREELTAQRFVRNPISPELSERLYRTGDIGRWLRNGSLEYSGRRDGQVKLRGMRVELGEIETVLAEQATISEVAVLLTGEGDHQKLTAYMIPKDGNRPELSELRAALQRKLPDHMVPSSYIVLDAFPLLPNGKLDRKALATMSGQTLHESLLVLARNEVEQKLVEIWQEVLELEQVGVDNNFFDLGGHSLVALQVIARIRRHFEIEIPLRTLFEHPTISAIASEVEKARALGLKPKRPILSRRKRPATPHSQESLVTQINDVPADEVQALLQRALGDEPAA